MKKVIGIGRLGFLYFYDVSYNYIISVQVSHSTYQLQEWFNVPVFDNEEEAEKEFLKKFFSDHYDDKYENTLNTINE